MKKKYFIIFLISLSLSSCDLFTTRDPASPEKPRDNIQLATTPQQLIQNLQNSFKDKVVENYITCFSRNRFVFSPSAGSMLTYPSLQSWDLKSEEQYFRNMVNAVDNKSQIELGFSDEDMNRSADSVIYSATYLLTVPFVDNQKPKSYKGTLHFTMIQDSTLQWTIKSWQDIKDQSMPAWSELKGRLY